MTKKDRESEVKPSGFAVIGRFLNYKTPDEKSEKVELAPGEAVIFNIGGGFKKFPQSEMVKELKKSTRRGDFEVLGVCDIDDGGVGLIRSKEESYSINKDTPEPQILTLTHGKNFYVVIWGETEVKVRIKMRRIAYFRSRRN